MKFLIPSAMRFFPLVLRGRSSETPVDNREMQNLRPAGRSQDDATCASISASSLPFRAKRGREVRSVQLDAEGRIRQDALHAGGFHPGNLFQFDSGGRPEGRAIHSGLRSREQIAGALLRG